MKYLKKSYFALAILVIFTYIYCSSLNASNAEEISQQEARPPSRLNIAIKSTTRSQKKEQPPPNFEVTEDEISKSVQEVVQPWTDEEATVLAKMLWGEARGVASDTEKAAVVWCALNHVDAGYGDVVTAVTTPGHFVGYQNSNPVDNDLKALCEDVLARWYSEKDGIQDVGRVLPKEYIYFSGDGERNYFRNAYIGGNQWDWSLPSPYKS